MPIPTQTPSLSHGSLVYYGCGWALLRQTDSARASCRWQAATGHLGRDNFFFRAAK
ncbi:MAG: hypothetical protein M0T76_04210 [Desulfobacteraceae bacterium]|nr:hypothetical protein [Desulfobacteraceae bacterium]